MATAGPMQYGVTAPLSNALPTEAENQASNELIEELKRQNNYESTSDTNKRTVVLQSLQSITEEFVRKVSRAQGLSENVVKNAGGKIFTYGSFRLGVFGPGSDIDTLVVVPKHITIDDYFLHFPDLLIKMAPSGAITDLTPVTDSFVPIIKFEYSGISIDLIFSRLAYLSQVPKDLTLADDNLLRGLSEPELRSLNGTRVTDDILNLVPQKTIFRTALRAIKLWAQRRAIYANIMGFPGGVAWAMLVARVCQLYPKATSSTVVLKFFRIMEKWQWPTPVLLKPAQLTPKNGTQQNVRVWNPKVYHSDRNHLMPIITPAYPSMCATHNITRSTQKIICRELRRGGEITDKIMTGKNPWKDLFVKHTFFTQGYKYYLSVIAASTTTNAQLIWAGWVESKVRLLVANLEDHESIALAHPFNKGFERIHKCQSEEDVEKAKSNLEFQIKEIPAETTDLANLPNGDAIVNDQIANGDEKSTVGGGTMVYTTTWYIGLELQEGAKSLDLSWQVDNFKRLCMGWEKHDPELNALNVIHTKNYDLPEDVFGEGEIKPARPQKRKAVNGAARKRPATEESSTIPPKRQQTSVA
ncbi:Poly(A) polymerase [Lachnellula occidentalis]|uniref:Poly(A) polymerase n=1 Tax=Lachnellula occidentalis TaxID=215460 RepID=A0A8H8S4N9_9HELO|nr:Poly(A) polymerase [Lachnellula occidentalis]